MKKLNKLAKDETFESPFQWNNKGSMAYIGDWNAILDRTGADGVKTKESGRVAWILWRSAYFTMTLSMRNKYVLWFVRFGCIRY